MKYAAQLQEDAEERKYYLQHIAEKKQLVVREQFIFKTKRGESVFPRVFSRKGAQILELCEVDGKVLDATINPDIKEDATTRKKLIWQFLRKSEFLNINQWDCIINIPVDEKYMFNHKN